MSGGDGATLIRLDEDTEVIKASDQRLRYTNTRHNKVSTKMFDPSCDVRLNVGNEIFKAHKVILSDASDYFSAMFRHNMTEKEKGAVEIFGVSPRGFRIVLEYFYHGHVLLDSSNVEDCLDAARFFQVEWLVKACSSFLIRHTSITNCSYVVDLADKYALTSLRDDLFSFFGHNLLDLDDEGQLVDLPLDLLAELLSGEHYIEASEEMVLQAVVNWVNHDYQGRKYFLQSLVQTIRFNLMDPEQLDNIPAAILELDGVQQRVEWARTIWTNRYAQCLLDQTALQQRAAAQTLVALSTHDADVIQFVKPPHDGSSLVVYKERLGCDVINVVMDHTATTTLGNFVFVAGGYDSASYNVSSSVYRYDPRFSQWLLLASLNVERVNFALFVCNSQLLAVGGTARFAASDGAAEEEGGEPGLGEVPLRSCEKYDPQLNQWTFLPELHFGCFGLAGSCINGIAYVCGGITDNPSDAVPVNYTYSLSAADDTWTPRAPMLCRRHGHGMATFGGKLYAFGGHTAGDLEDLALGATPCSHNECYDPLTDQWTSIAPAPASLGLLHKDLALFNGTVYILGGQYSSRYLHEYHIEKDEWKEGCFCGNHLIKLVTLEAAVPYSLPSGLPCDLEQTDLVSPPEFAAP